MERSPCNGRDVGKAPILVVGGRETYFAETGEGILAELPQPWQVAASRALLEFSEAFQVGFQLLGCCDHVSSSSYAGVTWRASLSISTQPFSSSSSASSGPPEPTIRPFTRT